MSELTTFNTSFDRDGYETANQERAYGRIEGYARALDDLMFALTGDSNSMKTYDPMTIRDGIMHSYAFNLKDGGRHHPLSDYSGVAEVCQLLLREACEWLRDEHDVRLEKAPPIDMELKAR